MEYYRLVVIIISFAKATSSEDKRTSFNNNKHRDAQSLFDESMEGIRDVSNLLRIGGNSEEIDTSAMLSKVKDIAETHSKGLRSLKKQIKDHDREGMISVIKSATTGAPSVDKEIELGSLVDLDVNIELSHMPVDFDYSDLPTSELVKMFHPEVLDGAIKSNDQLVHEITTATVSLNSNVRSNFDFTQNLFGYQSSNTMMRETSGSNAFDKVTSILHERLPYLVDPHKKRHNRRLGDLQTNKKCAKKCSIEDRSCTCEKLLSCSLDLNEYDLAVSLTEGYIEKDITNDKFGSFTINMTDLDLFNANKNIVQRFADIKEIANAALVLETYSFSTGNQCPDGSTVPREDCLYVANSLTLTTERYIQDRSILHTVDSGPCGCFVNENSFFYRECTTSVDGVGSELICKVPPEAPDICSISLLSEFVSACPDQKSTCSGANSQTYELNVDEICMAVNANTKLSTSAIYEKLDPDPVKWKADIGWNGNCELLSYASCASAVRSFSLLYEGRARDTTVYPDGNPFHDQTMVNQATLNKDLNCMKIPVQPDDVGWPDIYRGWYDISRCGSSLDYCRWVGASGSGGDPTIMQVSGDSFWSCSINGAPSQKTPSGYLSNYWIGNYHEKYSEYHPGTPLSGNKIYEYTQFPISHSFKQNEGVKFWKGYNYAESNCHSTSEGSTWYKDGFPDSFDPGWPDNYRGWYDVSGCGKCLDYCRWVGGTASGGDPTDQLVSGDGYWSCALNGMTSQMTEKMYFNQWTYFSLPSTWGADKSYEEPIAGGCYRLLSNVNWGKQTMENCDSSLSLLAGRTISIGSIKNIAENIMSDGLPGACCLDTPTTSSYFGLKYDASKKMTCKNRGPFHLGLSADACHQANGIWERAPCNRLKQCVNDYPKYKNETGYSRSLLNFAEGLQIKDASIQEKCGETREKLGYEKNFIDDVAVCAHFYDLQCHDAFDAIDEASKNSYEKPGNEPLVYKKVNFPELPYLPYIAIENIYNGTNTPWKTRTEQSKMRTTILNIDNSLDMNEVVYNMYEINSKALCDAIPDETIYIVERGICLAAYVVSANIHQYSRIAQLLTKQLLSIQLDLAENYNMPFYDVETYQNLNKQHLFTNYAFNVTNTNMIIQHQRMLNDTISFLEWMYNSQNNYTTCLTNFIATKIGNVVTKQTTNCIAERPPSDIFGRRLRENNHKLVEWNSTETIFQSILGQENHLIQIDERIVEMEDGILSELHTIKAAIGLQDATASKTAGKTPKEKKSKQNKNLFTRNLLNEELEDEDGVYATKKEVSIIKDSVVQEKNEIIAMRQEVTTMKDEVAAMKDMMALLIKQNQKLIEQNKVENS